MRELKFRAWHKKYLKYYEVHHLHCGTLGVSEGYWATCKARDCIGDKDIYIQIQPNDCIIEQFTGLRDKNGREIYEGDIIRIIRYGGELQTNGNIFEEKGAFRVRNGYAVSDTDILGQFKPDIIGVIGNIHENPELLDKD